jgi:hypothetical protein
MKSTASRRIVTTLAALAVAALARRADAQTVVQVNVDSVIDGRTVSTAMGNTITPWTAAQGVDGDGNSDGFVTNAVETILATMNKTVGGKVNLALPDDGMFPADSKGRYPAIQLHFSNAASTTSPQTHQIYISATRGSQIVQFDVPQATYSKMFLLITASEGGAKLAITLNYAGGTAPTTQTLMLPDYGIGGAAAGDPVFFNLIAGMHKWNMTDNEGDSPTHGITGIELNPSATGMLTSVKIEKMNGSHCVFWGATGIATSAVMTGAGGSGGASGAGGAAGTTGAGGAGGEAGGAGGAAGATGTGGSTTGAAGSTTTGTAGDTGVAGSTTGAAGTGTVGTPGTAGTGTTGAAGTTGTAGSTGSTGAAGTTPEKRASSGGCTLAGAPARDGAWLIVAAGLGLVALRRRQRTQRTRKSRAATSVSDAP